MTQGEDEMPIMRQYKALKREAPEGCILLFRMGDFWEAFGEDAVRLSPIFGTTLARRNGVPMTGCAHWSLCKRMSSRLASGSVFALAEVVEFSKRGIPRREIVRIVTPGTFHDENKEEQK